MVRISGLINTLNEADNIRYAVASLASWCDEVLVVDQMSDDDTAAIAERAGARVVRIPRTGYVEIIRKQSVEMTTGDWVFVLDADEIVHPRLATRLREIAERGEADVVKIPRRNIILGEWLKHGQWWPNDKRRFFHKDHIDVRAEMHGGFHCKPGARELILPPDPEACMWHFSYHTIEDIVWKTNRYTTFQAQHRAKSKHKLGPRRWLRVVIETSWREFVKGRAWKDGATGIVVSAIRVFDRFLVQAKEWDERRARERPALYRSMREGILGLEPDPTLPPPKAVGAEVAPTMAGGDEAP
jgi:glycosyltransferase involved in cell wall biosynthesis